MEAAESGSWTGAYWLIAFAMWVIMMVAMMLPSASPLILLYANVVRQAERKGGFANATAAIAAFAFGYLALWSLFSAFAVAAQFTLERISAMNAMMVLRSPIAVGAVLIAAGLYQLSPLKQACLAHCRSPANFLAAHCRQGVLGAFHIGLEHGLYCLGCCAALMALLFVGGIMNLIWIAGLTVIVALEKLLPYGDRLRVPLGALLMMAGAALMARG
jgi:predicted metal-binding membrane protein